MSRFLTVTGRVCPIRIKAAARRSFLLYASQQASRGNPIQAVHMRELLRREIDFFRRAAEDEAARFGRSPPEVEILDLKARLLSEPDTHGSSFARALCRRRLQAETDALEVTAEPYLMAAE